MPNIHNRNQLKSFRKKLRNNLTSAEATLWIHLKSSKLGKKIRRQHSIGPYVIDFYCATERVAIELDGAQHFIEDGMRHDELRTKYLNSLNVRVIRFENVRVFEELEKVLEEIRTTLMGTGGSPSVPPETGGKL